MANERAVQTEVGTWLAYPNQDCTTPPLEERVWLCALCFADWHEFISHIPPTSAIDWNHIAREVGPKQAERLYNLVKGRHLRAWERLTDMDELHLKKDVCCKSCKATLNRAVSAFVEVY